MSPTIRYQAIQHFVQLKGPDQNMRFWCFRGTHQFDRRYLRRDIDLYERTYHFRAFGFIMILTSERGL